MQLTANDLEHLSSVKSLWDVMGYPKLAGHHEAGAYYYTVNIKSGNGSVDRLLKTYDRQRALSLLATLPQGSYVAMYHSQTHDQVGEQGRADERIINVLLQILEELETCSAELRTLTAWRDEQMWKPEPSLELAAINNRLYLEVHRRYEQLRAQGRVIAAAVVCPPESVIW